MSLFHGNNHKRAEQHLDAAADQVIAATENLKLAAEHNDKARRAHRAAIDYHSERMAETHERNDEIVEWQQALEGVIG